MANSCSYIIDGKETIDTICFATFRQNHDEMKIIIEKSKFSIDKDLVNEYLKDLSKVFNFTFIFDEVKERFELDLSNIEYSHFQQRILLSMFVRFIWEGNYNVNPDKYEGPDYDNYYKILPIYFNFKKYYPKTNRFKLLLMSCNWYLLTKPKFNSNHFLTYSPYMCKLDLDVNSLKQQNINEYCKSNKLDFSINSKLITKEDYRKFYKLINK